MAGRRVVQVDVPPEDAELVADLLWQGSPSAVSVEERTPDCVRLVADLADLSAIEVLPERAVVELLDPDDEAFDAWRAWAAPIRAGRRVILQPAWVEAAAPEAHHLVIELDPGRTFGSGSHESTRLCVGLIEDLVAPGQTVLDVGTGSGVLAIVACRLGAGHAVAIDVDPEVLDVVPVNAAANGCDHLVRVSIEPLSTVPGEFDLVLANIGLGALRDLQPELERHVAMGGHLLLAGLLDDQADELVACFVDCAEVERRHEGGWTATVLQRRR